MWRPSLQLSPNLNRVLQLNIYSTQYRFFSKFINHCLDFHQQFKIGGYFTFSLSMKFLQLPLWWHESFALKVYVSAFNSLLCFVKATLSTTIPPCLPILSLTINEGHADRYMEAFHIKWRRRHGCVIEIGHGIHQRGGVYMWGWRKRAKSLLTRVCLRLVLWSLGIQSFNKTLGCKCYKIFTKNWFWPKNTIKDGGSTVLLTAYTVCSVYTACTLLREAVIYVLADFAPLSAKEKILLFFPLIFR